MPNTHLIADTMAEMMAREEDLLPACVISTTWPTVPVSSMTLAAFTTQAYIRDGQHLVYGDQPAITLPLTGSDGTYWLGITRDTSTAYASWTRRAGSHYMWRLSGTRPPDVDGLLVFASCTVAGGIITAVTPAPGVTRAEAWRSLSGLGTMAVQNANAVAITGGSASLTTANVTGDTHLMGKVGFGDPPLAGFAIRTNALQTFLGGSTGINKTPATDAKLTLGFDKGGGHGVGIYQLINDGGSGQPIVFYNTLAAAIGSISSSNVAVAYNTTSDARLKHAITALAGALDVVQALKPVHFLWNANDEPGEGFLAHELMRHVPAAVTGEPDAVHADGSVKPQQVDHSKLVPWITAALQETLAQVQALAARVVSLEEQLGV